VGRRRGEGVKIGTVGERRGSIHGREEREAGEET
jgi:hypothetical protein